MSSESSPSFSSFLPVVAVLVILAGTPQQPSSNTSAISQGGGTPAVSTSSQHTQSTPPTTVAAPAEEKKPEVVVRVVAEAQKSEEEKNSTGWWRFFLNIFFPWPALIIAGLLYLRFSKKAVAQLKDFLSLFKSIKFFGNEFVLSSEAGRDAEYTFRLFRKEVQQKLDDLAKTHLIAKKHKELIDTVFQEAQKAKMRSTIHVPDMLFENTLYQLIEYYPESNTHHGRIFSARYGIIGKAWRSEKAQWALDLERTQDNLVNEWGMTKAEAAKAVGGKKSYASLILKDSDGDKKAVLFIESSDGSVFDNCEKQRDLELQISEKAKDLQLIGALSTIKTEIMSGPRIEIFDAAETGHK